MSAVVKTGPNDAVVICDISHDTELSISQIASVMNISNNDVRVIIDKAFRKLKMPSKNMNHNLNMKFLHQSMQV